MAQPKTKSQNLFKVENKHLKQPSIYQERESENLPLINYEVNGFGLDTISNREQIL